MNTVLHLQVIQEEQMKGAGLKKYAGKLSNGLCRKSDQLDMKVLKNSHWKQNTFVKIWS